MSELRKLNISCVSQLWALCEDSAVWAERTGFERCQKVARRVLPEECHQARPDHPLLDFTLNGSQAVALAALISEEGRQLELPRADACTVTVATQRNRNALWTTDKNSTPTRSPKSANASVISKPCALYSPAFRRTLSSSVSLFKASSQVTCASSNVGQRKTGTLSMRFWQRRRNLWSSPR